MVSASHCLITGANGFIGSALCRRMLKAGLQVRGALRTMKDADGVPQGVSFFQTGELGRQTDWHAALSGVDTVIHLAGRVHIIDKKVRDVIEDFRRINTEGTESLARASALSGVRRFIYLSSIAVNGEFIGNEPFTEKNEPNPQTVYAISKWEAEQALRKVSQDTGMEIAILRPPLVYGPGVKANFKNLIKIAGAGLPLPFKGIKNRRSYIYIGNLVDAIAACVFHPLAAGETFMVSDGQDISTPDLIKMIALKMNKKVTLFSLHPALLKTLCQMSGKDEELEKISGALLVDSSKIRHLLEWKPLFTLEEGIEETVKHYLLS